VVLLVLIFWVVHLERTHKNPMRMDEARSFPNWGMIIVGVFSCFVGLNMPGFLEEAFNEWENGIFVAVLFSMAMICIPGASGIKYFIQYVKNINLTFKVMNDVYTFFKQPRVAVTAISGVVTLCCSVGSHLSVGNLIGSGTTILSWWSTPAKVQDSATTRALLMVSLSIFFRQNVFVAVFVWWVIMMCYIRMHTLRVFQKAKTEDSLVHYTTVCNITPTFVFTYAACVFYRCMQYILKMWEHSTESTRRVLVPSTMELLTSWNNEILNLAPEFILGFLKWTSPREQMKAEVVVSLLDMLSTVILLVVLDAFLARIYRHARFYCTDDSLLWVFRNTLGTRQWIQKPYRMNIVDTSAAKRGVNRQRLSRMKNND
jgi:hypothetical protein